MVMSTKQRMVGAMVTPLCLETLVLLASVFWVFAHASVTLPVDVMALTAVCLGSQFCALTVKMFRDEIDPDVKQYYRSKADPGFLCSLLVPLAVLADIVHMNHDTNIVYANSMLGYACFSSTQCALFMISSRAGMRGENIEKKLTPWCLTSILISVAEISSGLLIAKLELWLIILILVQAYLIFTCLRLTPCRLPKCFTVGELSCCLQISGLVIWRSVHSLRVSSSTGEQNFKAFHIDCLNSILYISIAAIIVLFQMILKSKHGRAGLFYVIGGVVSLVFVMPLSQVVLEQNLIHWMFSSIFGQRRTISLFLYWVVLSVIAMLLVAIGNPDSTTSSIKTVVRKYFHLVVVAVYIPGLIFDAVFLHLASVFAGAFFLLLEVIRVYSVPPFGQLIDNAFRMFVDEKDEGDIILTHIYLLVGLSLPLWITNFRPVSGTHLFLYSGVISLGIGDTAASIGGTLYGKHKWPGSKKSIEGTIFCVIAQYLTAVILITSGAVSLQSSVSLVIPVILSSLYEACTHQIDNLVLPLLTYSLLCVS